MTASAAAPATRSDGFCIAHITDTHLGAEHREFEPNFRALADELRRIAPELVIHTGDITVNGADEVGDHHAAHALHGLVAPAWRVLPGNHDLGDNPHEPGHRPACPITSERLARYRAIWGPDFWATDAGEFRVLGLNAQLLGTDLREADDQWDFLSDQVSALQRRPLALFLHKPLFLARPDEGGATLRYVPLAPRRRLLDLVAVADLRLVASGHVHQHRLSTIGRVLHAWGPSTAYILPDGFQETIGSKQLGFNLYRFNGDTVTAQVCTPTSLAHNDLIDFPRPYGSVRDLMQGRNSGHR